MAILLRIQHPVPSFDGWRRAFDADPMDRKGSGVRRFEIHRSVQDPSFVMIDLWFDAVADAERMLEKLQQLWSGAGKGVMKSPEAWVVETVESKVL